MIAGIKSLLKRPAWRTLLFVFFVLIFYYTRTRPPDRIHDIEIFSNYAFMAMGKTGVVVVDLSNPQSPAEVDVVDTYGFANSLVIAQNHVYVADGQDGLKILSLSSLWNTGRLIQKSAYPTPGEAMDLAIEGNHLYLIDGNVGVVVYRIRQNGEQLEEIHRYSIENDPQKIVIHGQRAFVFNKKNQLFIFDINPTGELTLASSIGVPADINNFAVDGDIVYLATQKKGLMTANFADIGNITINETVMESMRVDYKQRQGGRFLPGFGNAYDIAFRGNYAYVASGQDGFYVIDKSNTQQLKLIGFDTSAKDATQLGVLSQYVYIADGRIGLRANESPVAFIFQNANLSDSGGSFDNVVVKGNYAYVAAGPSGLQVVDISNLRAPVQVPFDDPMNDDYATGLDIQKDTLFVTYRKRGVVEYMLDQSPNQPVPSDIEAGIAGTANDIVVSGNFAYVAGGDGGFFSIDFSNSVSPIIHSLQTPGIAKKVFVLGNRAYVADGPAGIQIISISDPTNPLLLNTIDTPGDAVSLYVAKQVDESGAVRTYAFVADGSTGLYVVDVTDTNHPTEVARYETSNFANDVIVQGTVVFLADETDGLLSLDIDKISAPQLLGNQNTPGKAQGLYLRNDAIMFVADANHGLRIIDVGDPRQPDEIGFADVPKFVRKIVPQGEYGYAVDGSDGLWVLDISTPENPLPVSFYDTPGDALDIAIAGQFAFVADGRAGLQVVDISNKHQPFFVGAYDKIKNVTGIAVRGNYAYALADDGQLHILHWITPEHITEVAAYPTKGMPLDLSLYQDYVYIAEGDQGIEVVKIEDPRSPAPVAIGNLGLLDSRSILISDAHKSLFVADGKYGLRTFSIADPERPSGEYYLSLESGIANGLALSGNDLFMLVDQVGVFAFDVFDITSVVRTGEYLPQNQSSSDALPFQAVSIAVTPVNSSNAKGYVIYLPAGEGHDPSLQILSASGNLTIQPHQMYESPGEASLSQVVKSILASYVGAVTRDPMPIPVSVWNRLGYMCFGSLMFVGLSFLWLLLLAQFVLPTQNINDAWKAFTRFWLSLWGRHGPIVFIRDGEVICRPEELNRPGPGVARVDLNSALVLERRALLRNTRRLRRLRMARQRGQAVPRSRVEGPGVAFIEPYERIYGTADLRTQFRLRPGVRGNTRDGIEVENPIWIIFTLGQPPDILDVAYDGERKAENLRVLKSKIDHHPSAGKKKADKRKRMLTVQTLSDELDADDKEEIHRYIQQQEISRYFEAAKTLAGRIDLEKQTSKAINSYQRKISGVAKQLGLRKRSEVERFIGAIKELGDDVKNRDLDLRWFVYRARCLADQFAEPKMGIFYKYIHPKVISRYQKRLDILASQPGLVQPDPDQAPQLSASAVSGTPETRQFVQDALSLYEAIRPATEQEIALLAEPENSEEIEIRQTALAHFGQITQNLIRTDFPLIDSYRTMAERYTCFAELQQIARRFDLRKELKPPNFWRFISIRRDIKSIQQAISNLTKAEEQQVQQFLDLIDLYDYSRSVHDGLQEIRRNPTNERTRDLIRQARQNAAPLEHTGSKLLRKTARRIVNWAKSLDEHEPAQFYFFADRVDDLWKKSERAVQVSLNQSMNKAYSLVRGIQSRVQSVNAKIQSMQGNGEIQNYRQTIRELRAAWTNCASSIAADVPEAKPKDKDARVGPFSLFPKRVLAAVYSRALDRDLENQFMPWTDLPVHVAAQTYRDLVSKEYYDHLYQPDNENSFNLPALKSLMRIKMRNQGVLAFRFNDHIEGRPLEKDDRMPLDDLIRYSPKELVTPKVLRARGIKVIAAGFPDLFPTSRKVPEQLIETWQAAWQKQAMETRAEYQLRAMRVINRARAQAQSSMAFTLARILRSSNSDEALAMRVFQALESIARDEDTRQFLPRDTVDLLRSFKQWFLPGGDDQQKSMGDLNYFGRKGFFSEPDSDTSLTEDEDDRRFDHPDRD